MPEKITLGSNAEYSYEYTVTKKIPANYSIWVIGSYIGTDEYVPFCENDPDRGPLSVNLNTLLAVKMDRDTVKLLRDAAHKGLVSPTDCQRIIDNPDREVIISEEYNKETNRLAPIVKAILDPLYT